MEQGRIPIQQRRRRAGVGAPVCSCQTQCMPQQLFVGVSARLRQVSHALVTVYYDCCVVESNSDTEKVLDLLKGAERPTTFISYDDPGVAWKLIAAEVSPRLGFAAIDCVGDDVFGSPDQNIFAGAISGSGSYCPFVM